MTQDIFPPCIGCGCHRNTGNACQSDRCPCILTRSRCTESCRCRLCPNFTRTKEMQPCSCKGGCIDKPGKRATKCKCFSYKADCKATCICQNCQNGKEGRTAETKKRKRRNRSATTHVKVRTTRFLQQQKLPPLPPSSWTDQETTTLICCGLMLESMPIVDNIENLHRLYSLLANHSSCKKEPLLLRDKSLLSIQCKVNHLKKLNSLYE